MNKLIPKMTWNKVDFICCFVLTCMLFSSHRWVLGIVGIVLCVRILLRKEA